MNIAKWTKLDKYGYPIQAGDVCAISLNDDVQLAVYKSDSWGGPNSKGEYGRFITPTGVRTLKHSNVVFVFDPLGKRRSTAKLVQTMIQEFYEGK